MMIDLHCHILPGIDDGAPDVEASVEMAGEAVRGGTTVMVATPHVNARYRNEPEAISRLVDELNIVLAQRDIPLTVVPGAEVALDRLPDLTDEALADLCMGSGPYLLVESPYGDRADSLEEALFALQLRGLRPMLAHPERCPAFQRDADRLSTVVERGILCSITAGSMAGRFGTRARRLAVEMLRDGLVHDVASDAHDGFSRGPGLAAGFREAEADLPGIASQMEWFTRAAPTALLAGKRPPPRPEPPVPAPSRLSRLVRRTRGAWPPPAA